MMEFEECQKVLEKIKKCKLSIPKTQLIKAIEEALDEYDFDAIIELIEG